MPDMFPITLSGIGLSIAAGILLYLLLRKPLGQNTALMCVAALFYYLFWFFFYPNDAYTNDIDGHLAYMYHVYQLKNPYTYLESEHWHPPTYYWMAAAWVHICTVYMALEDRTALRLLSLFFYLGYLAIALKTLRLYRQKEDLPYFIAALLISFWPISVLLASRINNDVVFYVPWAAFYYYLSRWYKQWDMKDYRAAVIMLGISFAVKTNAAILGAILLCAVLYALRYGHATFRQFFSKSLWSGYAVLAVCLLINSARMIRAYIFDYPATYLGSLYVRPVRLDMLLDLDYYISNPYLGEDRFSVTLDIPNFVLKYFLYGQFSWESPSVASLMNIMLLLFILILVCNIAIGLVSNTYAHVRLYQSVTAILLPVIAITVFYLMRNLGQCLDARFIYPIVIPVAVMYMEGLLIVRGTRFGQHLYRAGATIGILLPSLGMLHYLNQYIQP